MTPNEPAKPINSDDADEGAPPSVSFTPTDPIADHLVFRTIGEEGFARLVAGFYRRVPGDAILGPMYPKGDLAGAEARLRDFLIFRFGGPERYIAERGHPRLRMRHAPFVIDEAGRNRWIDLMEQSLQEARLPPAAAATLRKFFHSTATFMINTADE